MQLLEQLGLAGDAAVVVKDLAEVRLIAPLTSPQATILAAGANFADHASAAKSIILGRTITEDDIRGEREQGLPPWGYTVLPRTVIGPDGDLVAPAGATMLDYEVEAAVFLKSGGRNIAAADIDVWGFTAWNDVSIRDHLVGRGPALDRGILVWAISKNFDGANPCGPWVVVDEPFDIDNLSMTSRVNGQVRQKSSTAQMVYSFGDIVEHLSQYVTLRPGDIFLSGTPGGCAIEGGVDGPFLRPGDEVEVAVGGVAVLRNFVKAASPDTL
jgi:2-keto-4-pentenoate hydratase/2-oxohepta-3-ene-1,7-dioic acid hydratase in catechol pathway